MKKKVLIYAYSNMNVGDDLFVRILCKRYPNVQFYMFSSKKNVKGLININNLTIIRRIPKIDCLFKKMNIAFGFNLLLEKILGFFCVASVNIGGSIFIQSDDWKYESRLYLKRIQNSKKFYIIGSNFGPYHDIEFLQTYKTIFQYTTDICFRDKHSYNLFNHLPVVRFASDVVFSLDDEVIVNQDIKNQYVVFSVIDLSNRPNLSPYEGNYLEIIAEYIKVVLSRGLNVKLISFCENEGDTIAIRKIISKFNEEDMKRISSENYRGNLDEVLTLLKSSKCIIATRFHAMILGWLFNKDVFPIIYSEKTLNYINDSKFCGNYLKITDIKIGENEMFTNFLNSNHCIDYVGQKALADSQFSALDRILNMGRVL